MDILKSGFSSQSGGIEVWRVDESEDNGAPFA